MSEAVGRGDGGAELGPLGADAAEVGRRLLDAPDPGHLRARPFEPQPAADAAVRTDGVSQLRQVGLLATARTADAPEKAPSRSAHGRVVPSRRERRGRGMSRKLRQFKCREQAKLQRRVASAWQTGSCYMKSFSSQANAGPACSGDTPAVPAG